jgi:hypothetical protein
MGDLKFKVKNTAGDDHELHTKLSIEGKTIDVKRTLRCYLGIYDETGRKS